MIVLVTMVYGPIAAFLVEFFPTSALHVAVAAVPPRERWFGGWLPFIATAMVAAATAGGMFAGLATVTPGGATFVGLWYPIAVAVMSLIIGGLWIRETKDTRIWDEVGGYQEEARAPKKHDHDAGGRPPGRGAGRLNSLSRGRPGRMVRPGLRCLARTCTRHRTANH